MEKSKKLYVLPMDMNWGGGVMQMGGVVQGGGIRGVKWDNYNSIINKIYFKEIEVINKNQSEWGGGDTGNKKHSW